MASFSGPPPGLSRPKTSKNPLQPPLPSPTSSLLPPIASPSPRRPHSASWASSLAAGLFPQSFELQPPTQVPQAVLPLSEAAHSAGCLPQPHQALSNNEAITNLAVFPDPDPSDLWHIAHAHVCAHATQACAACSVAFVCCSCRSLRFTPGIPPLASPVSVPRRSRSSSPALLRNSGNASLALFRTNVGNGSPPSNWDSYEDQHDDDAYTRALAEADTCDNSSCPGGFDAPARYTITVEAFDDGAEGFYDRTYRACAACNRSCKRSFLGCKIKARAFDNSIKEAMNNSTKAMRDVEVLDAQPHGSFPETASSRQPTPTNARVATLDPSMSMITSLQDALRVLNDRPPTLAAFVAAIRVRHDANCPHDVISCGFCSLGLVCCACHRLFTPAVARHLSCSSCGHAAFSCCDTACCCKCNKIWSPDDAVGPIKIPARRFYGGAGSGPGSNSSPEPDIWTPSPRSSPDEIDDLTARANIPLPTSRSESDASRAPSRASSVDEPANVAATPLPTPDYSSLSDEVVDGFVHPSFPDRAILDPRDKRHFFGRGDLSIASLKLYAQRIFSETSHWITAGHFLVDIFQGVTLNSSHDDFRCFVILVGTQLGYGDLAQRMSECLDVNRKMADEYMRLRDVATSWKQKAKANSKDARAGRKAQEELSKARGDITAILEEREIFIQQRREFLARDDQLTTELSRVHRDYRNAIEDNTQFATKVESLEQDLALIRDELKNTSNSLSMAEHHRDKAERDCADAVLRFDKSEADRKRDKAFYEARIVALSNSSIPTSQPDSEEPIKKAAIERSALLQKIDNLRKELSVRDTELAKLRSEVSLSSDVNVLRAELAEAKAVAARLSGMYEQKSKDFRDSEIERLSLLGKQILADGNAPKETPPARPRPAARRGRQRSRSTGRSAPTLPAKNEQTMQETHTPPSSQPFWQDEPFFFFFFFLIERGIFTKYANTPGTLIERIAKRCVNGLGG